MSKTFRKTEIYREYKTGEKKRETYHRERNESFAIIQDMKRSQASSYYQSEELDFEEDIDYV